jgi:hypothetical protein
VACWPAHSISRLPSRTTATSACRPRESFAPWQAAWLARGGVPLAAFGLSLHLFISVAAAAVFYLASRRVSWLVRHPYVSGVAFGICVYFVMGYVVVPLSAFPYKQASAGAAAVSVPVLLAHMFLFGLPIALCVRRWSSIPRL